MLRIPATLRQELVHHALDEAPLECCGLVGGCHDEARAVYRCGNAARSARRYEIDGDDQVRTQLRMEREGLELVAIYHSHTLGRAYPSATDVRLAFHPEVLYVIVGVRDPARPELRAFRIRDGAVEEVTLPAP